MSDGPLGAISVFADWAKDMTQRVAELERRLDLLWKADMRRSAYSQPAPEPEQRGRELLERFDREYGKEGYGEELRDWITTDSKPIDKERGRELLRKWANLQNHNVFQVANAMRDWIAAVCGEDQHG